jgi:hypothetical protein
MDSELIRQHIRKKKKTFVGTIILLLILTLEFYYLNCYTIYVPFYCELTFVYIILAVIVANVWYYFSGEHKHKSDTKEDNKKEEITE